MNCTMPGFPVLHYLPEFAQTNVHWVSDAIQLFHPPLPPSPLVLNLSQHLGLFQRVGSFPKSWLFASGGQNIGASASASVLPMNTQGWFPLGLTGLISLLSKRLSSTTIQKHRFFSTQPSLMAQLWHPYITGKAIALTIWIFVSQVMSLFLNRCNLI